MPKEYTLIGGNGTRVSPLEVTESGTYEAGDSRAFNPVKVNVPSGSSTLTGLTDVDISNPTDGQVLVYNAESGKWENESGGGGFKLFQVTFMAVDYPYPFAAPCLAVTEDGATVTTIYGEVQVDQPVTVKVVSFSDVVPISANNFQVDGSYMPVCTGGVELVPEGFMVTGDGTVTCKGRGGAD